MALTAIVVSLMVRIGRKDSYKKLIWCSASNLGEFVPVFFIEK
jgi:hypothetical protein